MVFYRANKKQFQVLCRLMGKNNEWVKDSLANELMIADT